MSRAPVRRLTTAVPTAGPGRIRPLAATALLLAAACASTEPGKTLLVSVAISSAPAVGELADSYEAEHPVTAIRINRGASGILMQQIRRGAPVDIFISASAVEIDRLAEEGLIDRKSIAVLASNRLVLVTPEGTGADVDGKLRLERFESIAIANPRTAPLGRYTRQAMKATGAWDTLVTRAVLGENARQVVEYVVRGEVDAGIVYSSDVEVLAGRVQPGPTLDRASHQPIGYYAAIPANAPHPEEAADLLHYLRSAAGTAVLSRHGFEKPAE